VISKSGLFLKYWVRRLFSSFSRFEDGGQPDLLLFANRRGGSTLLMDMIYSQESFNFIDQPFDFTHRQYNPYKDLLPNLSSSKLVALDEEDGKYLLFYVEKLLSRKVILRSQWRFWEPGYKSSYSRYVVKIVNAKALINWFYRTIDNVKIVYLVRHPIPNSLSVMQKGWELTTSAYLNNKIFVEKYLLNDLYDYVSKIADTGSPIEKHVLNWCLENLVPIRSWGTSDWYKFSYEHIVTNPQKTVQDICENFKFTDSQAMLDTIATPTRTSSEKLKTSIRSIGEVERISRWMDKVDGIDLDNVQRMLDIFEIDLYHTRSPYPNDSYFNL